MKRFISITAAAFVTASCVSDTKSLVFRCENPTAEFSISTLVINEGTGQIIQTWDADGYKETNKGTFKDGGWYWKAVTDEAAGEAGIVNEIRLDRSTGIISNAIEGSELLPNGEVCLLSN